MESTRDIRRLIEREIKKGSAPLIFDHIDYRADALHEIQTESDLKRVLVYLFRIAEYENLANEKNLAMQDAPFYLESDIQKQIYHLLDIRAVIFSIPK